MTKMTRTGRKGRGSPE